ncbi:MAG: type II toxin-antitoxin system VapC family toxin [Gammaproteobacteria bacterium]
MILVDSNIIIDILTDDPKWGDWSINTLESQTSQLAINPIIFSEVSIKIDKIELLNEALSPFKRLELPYEAAFLAGKAFLNYRKRSGNRSSPFPDFFIGAHAAILNMPLITRDINRYKTYFPKLKIIHP